MLLQAPGFEVQKIWLVVFFEWLYNFIPKFLWLEFVLAFFGNLFLQGAKGNGCMTCFVHSCLGVFHMLKAQSHPRNGYGWLVFALLQQGFSREITKLKAKLS